MKVGFISHDAELYGATRSLISLVKGLQSLDVKCYMIFPYEGVATQILEVNNIPYVIIPYQRWASTKINNKSFKQYFSFKKDAIVKLYQNIKVLPKIVKQLKEWDVDIVYTNTFVIPVGALSSILIEKPHVWHIREFVNTDFYLEWGKPIFRYLLSKSKVQLVSSNSLKDYIVNIFNSHSIHVVYNGIAFNSEFDESFNKVLNGNNHNRPYTFAIIGIINDNKNQKEAIEALGLVAKKYKNTRLLIVGAGDLTNLKILVDKLCLENNVVFLGHMNDPFPIYSKIDAVLVCSKNEGFGRVAVEAMSYRLPVIGFNSTGTAEIIVHNFTGLLYKGGAENLAVCMEKFINNPSWAQELGFNGWRVAKQQYSIEKYTNSVYDILREKVL